MPDEVEPSPPGPVGKQPPEGVKLSAAELQHRAISGSVWTAIHSVIGVPVNFATNLIVARELGPAGFGVVALLNLAIILGTKVSEAGFNAGVCTWGAAEDALGHRSSSDRLLHQCMGWQLLVEVPILGVIMAAFGWRHGPIIVGLLVTSVIVNAAACGPAQAIVIENRSAAAARLAIPSNLVLQAGLIIVAIHTHSAIDVFTARMVLVAPVGILLLIPLDRARRRVVFVPMLPRKMPPGFWRFAAQTTMTAVVGELSSSRDEIFVLALFGLRNAVGYFALAYGLSSQLTAPVDSVLSPLSSAAIGIVATAPKRAANAFLRSMRFTSAASGVLTAMALPLLTMLIPVVYGHRYQATTELIIPLGIASCLASLLNPVGTFVNARRRSDLILKANVIALGVDAVLAFSLIPIIGVWGAVVANILGSLADLPILLVFEMRTQGTTLGEFVRSVRAWLIALVATGLAVGVALLAGQNAWLRAGVAFSVGTAVFIGGIRLFHAGFNDGDREALLRSVPRVLRGPASLGLAVMGST
ncbi:MAG TPA: polysaccharide biosynthesis C-terminal domain-containing protein [Acidimicrobiales bacterium]